MVAMLLKPLTMKSSGPATNRHIVSSGITRRLNSIASVATTQTAELLWAGKVCQ
jgi:hypothetical protein